MLSNPPLSLYIHIPWCIKKCPYCDFNSHALKESSVLDVATEQAYVDRLLKDLELEVVNVWGRRLHSIFIGGGTPSLFSAKAIDRLLSGIRALIPFEGDIEITMEANPGTFEADKFSGFRQAGVNRLSIGVQSFNPEHLKALGRVHDPEQAIRAAEFALNAGFNSFNLDLMHGLPGQTIEQALFDLDTALTLKPHHISWYQLTLEPNTLFYKKPPQLPQDETLWDIQEQGQKFLFDHGYNQYETSAYCQAGQNQSKHNLNYWQFGDYLGIGAGAHGKITRLDCNSIVRTHKQRHPKSYLHNEWEQVSTSSTIKTEELPFEYMLNTLRLIGGAPLKNFSLRTGLPFSAIEPVVEEAIKEELLDIKAGYLKPSAKGALFLNDLLAQFMDILPTSPKGIINIHNVE